MNKSLLAFLLPCVLFSLSALAEQPLPTPQTQGDVTFVSGGVGIVEQNAMQAMRADYNLSLLFSIKGTGEYLSGVKVIVMDASDNTLLETVSDGPKFFAKLKPGRYTVSADRDGQIVKQRVSVGGKQRSSLSFTWPPE